MYIKIPIKLKKFDNFYQLQRINMKIKKRN